MQNKWYNLKRGTKKPVTRLKDFWDDFVQPSHFLGFFLSPESHLIGFCKSYTMASAIPAWPKLELGRTGQVIFRHHQITEDDLPGLCQFRLTTSRNWAGPGKSSSGVTKSWKMTYWGLTSRNRLSPGNSSSVIWWCRKIILLNLKRGSIGIFKLTFRRLKNPSKWLQFDKVFSEILNLLKMVLCSSRAIVLLKDILKTCRASSILQRIEWV